MIKIYHLVIIGIILTFSGLAAGMYVGARSVQTATMGTLEHCMNTLQLCADKYLGCKAASIPEIEREIYIGTLYPGESARVEIHTPIDTNPDPRR